MEMPSSGRAFWTAVCAPRKPISSCVVATHSTCAGTPDVLGPDAAGGGDHDAEADAVVPRLAGIAPVGEDEELAERRDAVAGTNAEALDVLS